MCVSCALSSRKPGCPDVRVDNSDRGRSRNRVRALLRGGGAKFGRMTRLLYGSDASTYVRKVTVNSADWRSLEGFWENAKRGECVADCDVLTLLSCVRASSSARRTRRARRRPPAARRDATLESESPAQRDSAPRECSVRE